LAPASAIAGTPGGNPHSSGATSSGKRTSRSPQSGHGGTVLATLLLLLVPKRGNLSDELLHPLHVRVLLCGKAYQLGTFLEDFSQRLCPLFKELLAELLDFGGLVNIGLCAGQSNRPCEGHRQRDENDSYLHGFTSFADGFQVELFGYPESRGATLRPKS